MMIRNFLSTTAEELKRHRTVEELGVVVIVRRRWVVSHNNVVQGCSTYPLQPHTTLQCQKKTRHALME